MESKTVSVVIAGVPTTVKVIVDWQKIARTLAEKAQGNKSGRASECSGAVSVITVPRAKAAKLKEVPAGAHRLEMWAVGKTWVVKIHGPHGLTQRAFTDEVAAWAHFAAHKQQCLRAQFDRAPKDGALDPPGYAARVAQLEAQGCTTSDAQGIADVEFGA